MARDKAYEKIKRDCRLIAAAFDFETGCLQELWLYGSRPCEVMLSVDEAGRTRAVRITVRPK